MFRTSVQYLAILFFAFASVLVKAQLKATVQHYSTENGLSHNRIMCMLRDQQGFMWFGSWDGLNRFDGNNFVVYKSRPGDSSSLGSSRIETMVEDRAGNIWLRSYDNRIYRFSRKTNQFLPIMFKSVSKTATVPVFDKIIRTKHGAILITTLNSGIFIFQDPGAVHPGYTHFSKESRGSSHIRSNTINMVYEDKDFRIWLLTKAGLSCLTRYRGAYRLFDIGSQYRADRDYSCIDDDHREVSIGTSNGEVITFDKHTGKFSINKVSAHQLTAIFYAKDRQNLYATTANAGLLTIGQDKRVKSEHVMKQAGIFYSIYQDRRGFLWLHAKNFGAVRYSPTTGKFQSFYQRVDAYYEHTSNFFKVFEDAQGLVWVSMRQGGFGYYDEHNEKIAYFYNEPGREKSLFSNVTILSYLDPLGNLWIHTDDKGLNKIMFSGANFHVRRVVETTDNRSDNEIRGIFNDSKNRLWLASKSGKVYTVENGKKLGITFENEPAQGIGIVYCITQDKQGRLWLGTRSNGLYRADPLDSAQRRYRLQHFLNNEKDKYTLSNNSIYAIQIDHRDRVWVGTFGGGINLVREENGMVTFLNRNNAMATLPQRSFLKVRYLREDVNKNIWIGTTDGLMVLSLARSGNTLMGYKCFTKVPGDSLSLGKNDIQYIFRDSKDVMWLATSGGGLNRASGGNPLRMLRFRSYTMDNGFPSDYVFGCTEDNSRLLWLSTENGLSRFNPQTGKVINFDYYNGLPKSGFSEASCLKLPSGDMVFGSLCGYVLFAPGQITSKKKAINMVLTKLLINNAEVRENNKNEILKEDINQIAQLKLEHDQNTVSIDYCLLDYRPNNRQAYEYRLIGFDNGWRDNKGERRATYTNLPHGRYTFQVRAVNTGDYLNTPFKSLVITILPPFYLTWWAYLIYILLSIVLIWSIRRVVLTLLSLRQRVVVGQKMADLKVNFFTKISHELRTPLTLIINPVEEIKKDQQLSYPVRQHLDIVSRNAKRLLKFINQLLEHNKIESGNGRLLISQFLILGFIRNICAYFNDVAREKNITLSMDDTSQDFLVWLDSEKIDVILYNVLSNAFKFSRPDTTIGILVSQCFEHKTFRIEIFDQAGGVEESRLSDIFELYYVGEQNSQNQLSGTGIGLALSREMTELHRGHIFARNNDRHGLTVVIELPLGKDYLNAVGISYTDLKDTGMSSSPIETTVLEEVVQKSKPPLVDAPLLLLVEDNSDLRTFLNLQLSQHYRVEVADNGQTGLNMARKLMPDLILSDVMMPEMDGIEMLEEIKNNNLTSHIPVILLTARSAVEHQLEGLRYGADYYVTKPFQNEFLLACITNLINQRKKITDKLIQGKKTRIPGPNEIVITHTDELFLKKIILFLEERMMEADFNIDDIAELMNMGRSTFYKKLKSLTTLTPVEFVSEIRIKRAKQYLDSGEYNISEIAYMVGFKNAKYFSTCFKEHLHLTPSDYLKLKAKASG
ncbi:hybrid sensor histidine kinase/response regulator transcription factor [Pedobacter jeongneungensis]|uniref:hybrid sensor histidine kinase/response regulator transcription factor n=1 Tax=Pedobacter jeongneungensis TaxID=947309 RepID=UPI0004698A50|nr:hybrid sensor histidine kinase/response regulator transcription factor [Pedobacter jeongneungensis]